MVLSGRELHSLPFFRAQITDAELLRMIESRVHEKPTGREDEDHVKKWNDDRKI
jgi:hypothetical protein